MSEDFRMHRGPWTLHVGDDGKAVYVEGWRPQHPDENNVERIEVVPARLDNAEQALRLISAEAAKAMRSRREVAPGYIIGILETLVPDLGG